MKDKGFPCEPDVTKPDSTLVFSFPVQAPADSVFRDDRSAVEQLSLWKTYQDHWCEHKPSITVYYKDHEIMELANFVYNNFNNMSGVSFLPHTDHTYAQAPYQEISEGEYWEAVAAMPKNIDWSELSQYESSDLTIGMQEYACTGGSCEII
jgi:ribonucleoside-diphosphate reductase alpha chain